MSGKFDLTIISTSTPEEARLWEKRLGPGTVGVAEEWEEGAGNGLGTLHALSQVDLPRDASIALYHTAGKGTRLAPLPSLEGNSKGAVRLPNMRLLEAVIKQTAPLAADRKGRVSVFWGDQLFFADEIAAPTTPVEIFGQRLPPVTEALFQERQLQRYGLLFAGDQVRQYNKGDYATVAPLLGEETYLSMGSFSLSRDFLDELLQEFAPELQARQGMLDTDPHFWMPLSLDNCPGDLEHNKRMRARFGPRSPLGVTEVDGEWWDFGNLRSYFEALRSLATPAGDRLRRFLGLDSLLIDCEIGEADVGGSLLVGVKADRVRARGSVLLDVTAPEITATDALLYQVTSRSAITAEPDQVLAGKELHELNKGTI